MTDGFTRRKEHSKEDIRRAAWELFSQFGVEKVSIVDIARKAGVSQATIYNNFGSKDALAREFVTSAVELLVNRVQEVLAPERPYWEKVGEFIRFISEMMAQGKAPDMDVTAFSSNHNLLNDPDLKKFRESAEEQVLGMLLGLVQEGKKEGQIRSDLSDEAFRLYFKAFMDIFTSQHFRQGYYRDPRLIQDLSLLLINGLNGGKA